MHKKLIGLVAILACLVVEANATTEIEDWSSTRNGTAKITTDDAGTATLTIDAVSSADLTASDDLNVTDDAVIGDSLTVAGSVWTDDVAGSGTFTENLYQPGVAVAKPVATRDALLVIGEASGTTAYGFDSASNLTYGVMMSFGKTRPAAASYSPGGFDSALEVRAINRMTNNSAYSMRGAHIKAKNYTSGTVGGLEGLFVEAVGDGTETASSVLKLGTDASTIIYGIDMDLCETPTTADIRFSNGALVKNGDANTLTITEAVMNHVGALQDDGVQVVVGNHATTRLALDRGTAATNGQVVAFATWFTGVPTVVVGYNAAETTNTTAYPASVTTNGFTVVCQPTKTVNWVACGPR